MPDVYANIASVDREIQERLISAMELRAAEPRQREILETYLAWIDSPKNARILEVGCGTGAVTRVLARRQGVASNRGHRSIAGVPRQSARAGGRAPPRDLP